MGVKTLLRLSVYCTTYSTSAALLKARLHRCYAHSGATSLLQLCAISRRVQVSRAPFARSGYLENQQLDGRFDGGFLYNPASVCFFSEALSTDSVIHYTPSRYYCTTHCDRFLVIVAFCSESVPN